jgi:beta-lactamase regulating signal transducer with metallopeptidase domain
LGIFKSIVVLSTGLARVLTPQQLNIICIHEQTHVRHHDNEHKWALRLLCVFHLPHVKHALLFEHALALEIRADQQVAHHIQDPIAVAVAETIVAMQRLIRPLNTNEPLCQFIGSALERRVQYLLAQSPGRGLPKYSVTLCLLAIILAMTCGSIPLHNALEALIT